MIIKCPDGFEFELKWAGQVELWAVKLQMRFNSWSTCNTAGFELIARLHGNKPNKKRISRHEQNPRCVRDYPWQCPYGSAFPCISKRASDNRNLATIEYTYWERKVGVRKPEIQKEYTGQLRFDIFNSAEQGHWNNIKNGKSIWSNEPRPYQQADLVCKDMAVASMEYFKRNHWGSDALKWRILPVDDDITWINNQQIKHSGRYDSCVFDIWD